MLLSFLESFLIIVLCLFSNVEKPVFNNGNQNLEQFLDANMVYPWYAKQNCIQGTIKVAFQLNSKGELANAKVVNGLGIDLDDEALRLVSLTSGKWKTPKGYQKNTEIIVPVKFALKNYNCENLSKQIIEKAITVYQIRQGLEDVVTSYYQNKIIGKENSKNEQEILRLKADLGFDEELVAEKLGEAKEMLKQGDQKGACKVLNFIKNIGFSNADDLIATNCK
ncbi:energy transducer TonB [Pedobacter arcticus]|uniref:energy transducer TonB n=1 Tax=Pedobacter arcticus TaxID=752140 RepID=UPI00031A3914|nr:energy transducer TonB [Pedobacter arcticus]